MGVLKAVSLLWGADTNVENDFDAYLNTVSYAEQSEFNRSAGAVDSLVKRLRPSKAWGKVSDEEQRAFAKNLKISERFKNAAARFFQKEEEEYTEPVKSEPVVENDSIERVRVKGGAAGSVKKLEKEKEIGEERTK